MVDSSVAQTMEGLLSRKGYDLRFAPALESVYEAKHGRAQAEEIRRYLLFFVAFVLVCCFCDVQAKLLILRTAFGLRLGLCIPVALLARHVLSRRTGPGVYAVATAAPMVTATIVSGVVARMVHGPLSGSVMIGPAVCIFAQTLIVPVPFRYALRGLLVALGCFVALSLVPWPGFDTLSPTAPTFACGMSFAALYERHRREYANRREFLLSEINRLRLEEILVLNAHLERLSNMDGLTGIFNRRYVDAALTRLWKVGAEKKRALGILLLDVDHFKALNDSAGHQHGDFCLQQVAQILQQCVRAGVDTVARYGGEEFIAILPEADESEVLRIGERVRGAIEDAHLQAANGSVVTISVGAVAVKGGELCALSHEDLVAAADQALYQAKRSGRNRMVCSGWALLQRA